MCLSSRDHVSAQTSELRCKIQREAMAQSLASVASRTGQAPRVRLTACDARLRLRGPCELRTARQDALLLLLRCDDTHPSASPSQQRVVIARRVAGDAAHRCRATASAGPQWPAVCCRLCVRVCVRPLARAIPLVRACVRAATRCSRFAHDLLDRSATAA